MSLTQIGWELIGLAPDRRSFKERDARLLISYSFLYNPFVFVLSTRGSCDAFVALMTAVFLLQLGRKQILTAGLVYGALVHLRIYPAIYALPLYFFLNNFADYVKLGVS